MQEFFKTIISGVREDFGYPVSLMQVLSDYPQLRVALDEPKPSICAQSVPAWHKLGTQSVLNWPSHSQGVLRGWKPVGERWDSFQIERPEYAEIGHCEITPAWTCDISDIYGFSASKSELRDFVSTDEMVKTNSPEMIDEITHEKLAQNLAHKEIRIIHSSNTADHFTRYLWDGRLWLNNQGGSHHTAAAKYIAARLNQPVSLTGNLHTYSLNANAVTSLCSDFEMFIINDDAEVNQAFSKAMENFKAMWLWHTMPLPYQGNRAILLPKSEARSMRVASELANAGITNLGMHLINLTKTQLQYR